MLTDDLFFPLGYFIISARVLKRRLRMGEAVQSMGTRFFIVPVIEKIVVQESTLYELLLFETERKDHRQEKRGLGHSDAVVIAGALAVLLEFLKLIKKTGV